MSQYWSRLQQREELLHPVTTPLHHRPPAVLLTHTRHRRVEKAREGLRRGKGQERREGKERKEERKTLGEPWDVWALFFQWDCVLFCSSRHIQKTRTRKERTTMERPKKKKKKNWTSVKCPVLKFLWNKNLSVFFFFFFSISNFSHCFLFFSGVLVNGHLYVNMKNQDQVLIDGLLENHVWSCVFV